MTKKLLSMVLLTVAIGAWAQSLTTTKMKVQLENGTVEEFNVSSDLKVTWEQAVHEYVDQGLPSGTMWATCNVGASSPVEAGDFFGWGFASKK